MALTFTGGAVANDAIAFNSPISAFPYGTTAAVLWLVTGLVVGVADALSVAFAGTGVSTDTNDMLNLYASPTNAPGNWDGTTDSKGPNGIATGHWSLIAVSKTTGTVAPRCHTFDFTTNTWTHAAATSTTADAPSTTDSIYSVNGTQGTTFPGINGHYAAVGTWNRRALDDGEIERLAAGSWNKYAPDFLIEFKSGRTVLGAGPLDHGRARMTTNTFGSVITRAAVADPPGFRFSPGGRRR